MSDLLDIFGGGAEPPLPSATAPKPLVKTTEPSQPEPTPVAGQFFGSSLSEDVQKAARAAANAADAEATAKAALDVERGEIQAKVDQKLEPLNKALRDAREARKEAEDFLMKVMTAEKITKIPMDDRPEIKIKVTPGRKKPVTRKWLAEPEGVVVKTYGAAAPGIIWEAIPRTDPTTTVIVPARYEDEPMG